MTLTFVLVILVVAVAGGLAVWVRWKRGPGEKRSQVWCPVFQQQARIVAVQISAELSPPDAKLPFFELRKCSLFEKRVPNCRAECLRQP